MIWSWLVVMDLDRCLNIYIYIYYMYICVYLLAAISPFWLRVTLATLASWLCVVALRLWRRQLLGMSYKSQSP